MRVVIPQIAWHARDPVLTLDFDPQGKREEGYYRIVTGGADKLLLIWHLTNPDTVKPDIFCVSELTRHQKGINVCRFSPCGAYIAAGDDDSYVFIWKNESISEKEEVWTVEKIFRRHVEDVSDLCWSPDSNYLVSGSVDNTSVLWDVKRGTPLHFWSEREHTGFVQGVAYDPLGEFCATMCIDRHLRFFNNKTGKLFNKALKYPPAWLGMTDDNYTKEKENKPQSTLQKPQSSGEPAPINSAEPSGEKPLSEINGDEQEIKPPPKKPVTTLNRLFYDDTLKTFCRRLSFSSRGELLIVPGGLLPPVEKKKEESREGTPINTEEDENSKDKPTRKADSELNNAVVIFCRNSWTNPCAVIPTGRSYSIAARFSPVHYQRERKPHDYDTEFVNSTKKCERFMSCVGKIRPPRNDKGILLDMPYRLVYAVATNDSILIGDTASTEPLACIKNIHCTRLTDISWSPDGLILIASSTDGYCSILTFEKNELGEEFKITEGEFPELTPTCFPIAPPEPKPVKKKEPKEPKEVKEKEPKEKREVKEKEPKEKKKGKDPATPTENKEEKKKKPLTILKMLSSVKSSPSSNSPGGSTLSSPKPQQDVRKLATPSQTQANQSPSVAAVGTPPVVAATPKPTFLDSWVKKTPVSSSGKKPPRRVQFTTLASTTVTSPSGGGQPQTQPEKSAAEIVKSQGAGCVVAPPASKDSASPSSAPEAAGKKPRRIPLITLDSDSMDKDQLQPQLKHSVIEKAVEQSAASSSPSGPATMVKKPRRIQLTTLTSSDKDQPPTKKAATEKNAVVVKSDQTLNGNPETSTVVKTTPPAISATHSSEPPATVTGSKPTMK